MSRWRWLGAGALSGCLTGCSGGSPEETGDSRAQPIVAGEASGADQDGVVLLRTLLDDGSESLCTASLVAPNLILTARHCVAYFTDGRYACSLKGELTDNPTGGGTLGLDLPPENLEVYSRATPRTSPLARGSQTISTLPPTICENDVAFVVLDTALDLPLVPLRLGRPAEPHEPVLLVGYGSSDSDQVVDYRRQPRSQKRDLEVAQVGPDSVDDVTTVPARTLFVNGPAGCFGDSGGPLLTESSGAVLGILSVERGAACSVPEARNQFVHLPAFQRLIDTAFRAAGAEPVPEPTEAAGSATDGGGGGGEPSAGGVGGAGMSNAAPHPKRHVTSGCSFAAPPSTAASALYGITGLALGVPARRRKARRRAG